MITGSSRATAARPPTEVSLGPTGRPGPTSTVTSWLTHSGTSSAELTVRSTQTTPTVAAGSVVLDPVSLPSGLIAARSRSPARASMGWSSPRTCTETTSTGIGSVLVNSSS